MRQSMRISVGALLLWMATIGSALADPCAGSPTAAVMKLPSPLDKWGTIVCTPYGHIISNHEGWFWTQEGGYYPVFVPSQMVRDNPARFGNKSYFTAIELARVQGEEFNRAYEAVHVGFAPDKVLPDGYRLDLTSV